MIPSASSGPWSSDEDDQLRKLAGSGKRLADIADELNRSGGAVRMRAARLNIVIANSGKLMACPAWLELSEDRTSFVFLPDRAKIVRQIFELSVAGLGGYTIAKQLNTQHIPTFGPSPKWDQSTIHNMLTNRATIGEHHSKRYATARERSGGARDRKGLPTGDTLRGYYPAVIEEDLFNRAQEARRSNLASGRGRKGRLITNLFAGIPTCAYCGAPIKFHSNGNAKSLICANVLTGNSCYRTAWTYQNFEKSFFELVGKLDTRTIIDQRAQEAVLELLTHVEAATVQKIYSARLLLLTKLKAVVINLKIACSGSAPIIEKHNSRIRRDQPGRYFDVTFLDGLVRRGFGSSKD
jgi:Recombinase